MIETKIRAGALIIEGNRLLLVSGWGRKEFWTPGGKIEKSETEEDCLKRELEEELGIKLISYKFYKEYLRKSFYHDYMLRNRMYLVSVKGKPKPGSEIMQFHWLSKKEFEEQLLSIIPVIKEEVIPDLIKDKLLSDQY